MDVVVYAHQQDGKYPCEEDANLCTLCVQLVRFMVMYQSVSYADTLPVFGLQNTSRVCKVGIQFWLVRAVSDHSHHAISYV